jgi:hypothetical protein
MMSSEHHYHHGRINTHPYYACFANIGKECCGKREKGKVLKRRTPLAGSKRIVSEPAQVSGVKLG